MKNTSPDLAISLCYTEFFKSKMNNIMVVLWDSAGSNDFIGITKNFVQGRLFFFIIAESDGVLLFFDANDLESLEKCITKWYSFVKENLDPEISKVLFVGNKIDKLGVNVDSKLYKSGSNPKFQEFDKRLQELKESEKGTEFEGWIDWTYTVATDPLPVQKTVKRLLKKYEI